MADAKSTLEEYRPDFLHLLAIARYVTQLISDAEYAQDKPTAGPAEEKTDDNNSFHHESKTENGCQIVCVFPHGTKKLSNSQVGSNPLYFTGFFGIVDPAPKQDVSKDVSHQETLLWKDLQQHPGMLLFASSEATPGGSWGTLVIGDDMSAITRWRFSDRHSRVIRDLAPKFFRNARYHTGSLPSGLSAGTFQVSRTTNVYFEEEKPKRQLDRWPTGADQLHA